MSFHDPEFDSAIDILDKSAATSLDASITSDQYQNENYKSEFSNDMTAREKNSSPSSGSSSDEGKEEEVDINSMCKTATLIHPDKERNDLMQQINERILKMLRKDPSNRTCADCGIHLGVVGSTVGSLSEIYVSLCLFQDESSRRLNSLNLNSSTPMFKFQRRHKEFQPRKTLKPKNKVMAVFPYGVFICELCSFAHTSLGSRITSVKSLGHSKEPMWSLEDISFLENWGGNTRSNQILERFMPEYWKSRIVPRLRSSTNVCSLEEREVFVRAKYESLAFVYPIGPLSQEYTNVKRWENSFQQKRNMTNSLKLWSNVSPRKSGPSSLDEAKEHIIQISPITNRLVDYFCIAGPDPAYIIDEQSKSNVQLVSKVLDYYPKVPHPDVKLPDEIARFVFPDGCCASLQPLDPKFFTFVLTLETGVRVYGASLTIYDESFEIAHVAKLLRQEVRSSTPRTYRSSFAPDDALNDHVFIPKTLVIISHYPFFQVFRTFLQQLYRISLVQTRLPLERYITNFVSEVPLPPRGKVEVKVVVADKLITIIRPPPNELPFVEISYRPLFACLSVSNIMVTTACLLQEARVALCSSRYSLLTPVSEALLSLIFPFVWQGCYVPVMPYSMLDVLDAPMPFFVGIHSRYLKNVSPVKRPPGVIFIDLDEDVVHLGTEDDPACTPTLIPALPEKEANKLKLRLDQHGSSAYLLNKSGIKGQITNGQFARTIPNLERELYAHQVAPNLKMTTPRVSGITPRPKIIPYKVRSMGNYLRSTTLSKTDEAFTEGEHRIPICNFASEEGTLLQVRRDNDENRTSKRPSYNGGMNIGNGGMRDKEEETNTMENIFDISGDESESFSAKEIRQAFLRFFVSIFKNYEKFLNPSNNKCNHIPFSKAEFLLDCRELTDKSRDYLSQVISTQMFERFIEETVNNSKQYEVLFFNESIIQKKNRSKKKTLSTSFKSAHSYKTPFLSEVTKYAHTETYSPPSVSNWGLPDDGRMYSYPHFPCQLDASLFGKKIRTPKVLDEEEEQGIRHSSLSGVTSFLTNLLKGGNNSSSTLNSKRLEWAINAIAYRHASSAIDEENDDNANLDESADLGSTSISTDDLYAAQALISSIRRKQVAVLATVVKIQSLFRMFICRKRYISMKQNIIRIENDRRNEKVRHKQQVLFSLQNKNAILIQRLVLKYIGRKQFLRTIQMIIMLQACVRGWIQSKKWKRSRYHFLRLQSLFRGRRVYFAYHYIKNKAIVIQSALRGWSLRKTLKSVLSLRMQQYRSQMLQLWRISYTSLVYRSQFCTWVTQWECSSLFLQIVIYEEELEKLWLDAKLGKALDIKMDPSKIIDENKVNKIDRLMSLVKIMNNSFYWRFLQVHQQLQRNVKSIQDHFHRIRHTHTQQERLQIYEALSALSNNEQELIYGLIKIPKSEKKRKVKAANMIWENDDNTEASVRIIIGLQFSDNPSSFFKSTSNDPITTLSLNSSKAFSTKVTKKGRKRLHIGKKQLNFSGSSDFVHTVFQPRLDVRIRKNLTEAARGCFESINCSQFKTRHRDDLVMQHWCDVLASNNDNFGHFCFKILECDLFEDTSFYSV